MFLVLICTTNTPTWQNWDCPIFCRPYVAGSILRPQTPLSYPSQNKAAQSDVTAETVLKSALNKHSEFQNKTTLLCHSGYEFNALFPGGLQILTIVVSGYNFCSQIGL